MVEFGPAPTIEGKPAREAHESGEPGGGSRRAGLRSGLDQVDGHRPLAPPGPGVADGPEQVGEEAARRLDPGEPGAARRLRARPEPGADPAILRPVAGREI